MGSVLKEYETKLDNKKRFTIRGAEYDFYHVKEFDDGHIELEPRILVPPQDISKNTLKMMDKSVINLKNKKVSKPINLDKYKE